MNVLEHFLVKKFQIAQNGPPFWQSDLLKFLRPFIAKYELSAPKNECFRALFSQKFQIGQNVGCLGWADAALA